MAKCGRPAGDYTLIVYHYGEFYDEYETFEKVAEAIGSTFESARWMASPACHKRQNKRKKEPKWSVDRCLKDEVEEEANEKCIF